MNDANDIVRCADSGLPYTECSCETCQRAQAFVARNAGRFRSPPPRPVRRPACDAPKSKREPKRAARPAPSASAPLPYADAEFQDNTWSPEPAAAAGPQLGSHQLTEEEFKALGVVDGANQKLIKFFEQEQNFGKWFSRVFLKMVCGNDYINNRADDARDYFVPKGLYLDNWQIRPSEDKPAASHYRLCRIEEALCLSATKKRELLEKNEH